MLVRKVCVAAYTEVGLVDRSPEFGHINEQGDLFAGRVSLAERLVPVALQAGAVFDRFGGERSRR
jgi:hypothetical protein